MATGESWSALQDSPAGCSRRREARHFGPLRDDRDCGVQFVLHGPRSMRLTAIWDADRGRVLGYDGDGERFLDVRVDSAAEPAAA